MARKAAKKPAAPERARDPKKTKQVDDYRHEETTRPNNPPAGLAWQDTQKPKKRTFSYDPHLDPQLIWSGKAERTSFEVEAPSIHVHERLSTEAILSAVKKEAPQLSLFETPELEPAKLIEFYEHEMNWVNRLILGDSLVAITSLIEKERLGGRVQMIYVDPPYGINYNSNFQARISDRAPKETADDSVTREPEQIQAYRDTWQLGVHSYLSYLRDRLLLSRELLADEGSVFLQIGPDRLHLVRTLLDEVFGAENNVTTITVQKTSQVTAKLLPEVADFLLWYAKEKSRVRYFQLFEDRSGEIAGQGAYTHVELADGTRRSMIREEKDDLTNLPEGSRVFRLDNATSQGFSPTKTVDFEFEGRVFHPGPNRHWLLRVEGLQGLAKARRLEAVGNSLTYVRYADEAGLVRRTNIWTDTGQAGFAERKKQYVVETNPKIVERCVLMSTQPGDLVVDPTCGSGTTAWVCEKHGRRWITCDTSRVAVALARERLLTAKFPYFKLQDEGRGVDAGLVYESQPWVKASSIGYEDDQLDELVLYDRAVEDRSRIRVSGPFTLEALSRYSVNPMQDEVPPEPGETDEGADHVATLLDALKSRGIPRQQAKPIPISSLQQLPNTGPIQAEGAFDDAEGKERTFAVSLGPRFGPITVAQVDEALHDAYGYDLVVFAGFAVDAAAQQYVAKGKLGRFNVALLEANPDLLIGDLLKSTPSSQTFRLFASPDATAKKRGKDEVAIELIGVDAFDASTGEVTSRGQRDIAAWFLDQDYDGIVFHVCQAFFPKTSGWDALERALKGTLNRELLEKLAAFESMPFKPGQHKRAALRVVDDSGSTSEAVLELK